MPQSDFKIYPSIGIARVGDSSEYYLAPEEANGLPIDPVTNKVIDSTGFRDSEKKLKRQAAEFKIFFENTALEVGSDIDYKGEKLTIKKITWKVHTANKKAGWYTFQPNINEVNYGPDHNLRNSWLLDENLRLERLILDAGAKTLEIDSSESEIEVQLKLNTENKYKYLKELLPFGFDTFGEVKADSKKLLYIGGYGSSGSSTKENIVENKADKVHSVNVIGSFANNDLWFDDTSDGSIEAIIELSNGQTIDTAPAWVITAPPSYAPEISNMITLYDTIYDMYIREESYNKAIYNDARWQADTYKPEFYSEIYPILTRPEFYSWVTQIPNKAHQFNIDQLKNSKEDAKPLREYIFSRVRPPAEPNAFRNKTNESYMPVLTGNSAEYLDNNTPVLPASNFLTLTETQYFIIQQWAKGMFTVDKANSQGDNIGEKWSKAVLENCVGGAFSPGIEMTWISKDPSIYSEPFRLKLKAVKDSLTWNYDMANGLEPGDVTKFMALPWQADFNECSTQIIPNVIAENLESGNPDFDVEKLEISWWPAQRPLFVIPEDEMNPEKLSWTRNKVDGNDSVGFSDDVDMVHCWKYLGFINKITMKGELLEKWEVDEIKKRYFIEIERDSKKIEEYFDRKD